MALTLNIGPRKIPTRRLLETKAFKRRNKEWEYMKWDYTEWEECLEEAKEELNGNPTDG